MRDATHNPRVVDIDLIAEPACCPGGVCGPIFETPLLGLAFNRLRNFVRDRKAATVAEATPANPLLDQFRSAPAVAAPPPRPQKDAPRD